MEQLTADKTKRELTGALRIVAIGETIRELGEVPSGHLYAQLMGKMDLATYQRIIDTLKRAGLVTESGSHLLTWTGPEVTR